MPERIPADGWRYYPGHVARYEWAAGLTRPGETVNDIACGTGYGATFFAHAAAYRGYDKPEVPDARFARPLAAFAGVDIDGPAWTPLKADVACCFETLEHVRDPGRLARVLMATTRRAIFVSVPVIPTVHCNEWHRTDFTEADIPPLFAGWVVGEEWPQPEETSHVWKFTRG
jgi:hypothetical protein